MTKLSSKASGCVEAAIGLGPEDTSRIMELHQLYADAGLSSDQAIRKAANDLVAELQEEATDITKAIRELMGEPQFSNVGARVHEFEMSTRVPSAVKRTEDPMKDLLVADFASAQADLKWIEATAELVQSYPNYKKSRAKTTAGQLEHLIVHMVDNLLWLHDQVPAATRQRSKLWYDGARAIVDRWTRRYGITDAQAAGVLAVLSPQKDWFMNVSLARRVADIVTERESFIWSPQMEETAARIFGKDAYQEDVDAIRGKALGDLDDSYLMGMWTRVYDQAHESPAFDIISPEGDAVARAVTKTGAEGRVAWGGVSTIAKAISIIRDGSMESISQALGQQHKVRNFYNNILVPGSINGHVTIDTHAVAAALLRALSGSSREVMHNFGGGIKGEVGAKSSKLSGLQGTYALYEEAYRRAAEARGILPREMQSITWEAIRGMYLPRFKSNQKNVDAVDAVWSLYQKGKISHAEARNQVLQLAGGIQPPSWSGPNPGAYDADESADDAGDLSADGVPGADPGEAVGGADRGAAGAVSRRGGQPQFSNVADRGGRDEGRILAPLEGAPAIDGATGPDPRLVDVAERYARQAGISLKRQAEYVKVDPERAARIAAAYDAMPHAPNDPKVKEAFDSLIRQTRAQYDALAAAGYEFTFFDDGTDPYGGNPWNAMRDLRANKKMAVYGTYAGYGTEGITADASIQNPMLAKTDLQWPDQDGVMHQVTANDLFRAVHDAFGHGLEGSGFRAQGEENAWQAHVRLFTGSAVAAITTETRGQNSWLNYGPYGERNRAAGLGDTVFAPQKTGLMPEWAWTEGRAGDMADPKFSNAPTRDATLDDFKAENLPNLLQTDRWAVLTAEDPGAQKASAAQNRAAMQRLKIDLREAGAKFTPVVGKYGDVQGSLIVTGIDEDKAIELGKKYGQESILTRRGLVYMDGRPDTKAVGVQVFDQPPEDFYTEVPSTGAFFSVDLDWGDAQFSNTARSAAQPDLFPGEFATKRSTVETSMVIDSKGTRARGGNVNSKGQQITATKQGLKRFWDWFEGSEATDGKGRPLVLYHSTNGDISQFETNRESTNSYGILGEMTVRRAGIFMTPDDKFSQEYLRDGAGQNVMQVYAALKRPLDLRTGLKASDEQELESAGISTRFVRNAQNYWELFDSDDSGKNEFVDGLRAAGYDGAIFMEDSPGGDSSGGETYVAFDAAQVKSATGNRGAFNPYDPDIRYSQAGRLDGLDGYHFSKAQRTVLTGGAYGTNFAGSGKEEYLSAADKRRRQRVYFYVDKGTGINPESGVGGYAHRAVLNNVYDADSDPLNLTRGSQAATETAILDAGFDGYLSRLGGTQSGQVIMLGPKPIKVDPLPAGERPRSGKVVPAATKKAEMAKRSGNELVRKPAADDMMAFIDARRAVEAAAPSFRMEYGEARVKIDEAAAADAAFEAAGAKFRFGEAPQFSQAPQVDTPEFKAWFKDSKVVDADGKPLVVYHGTRTADRLAGEQGFDRYGAHFGTTSQASQRAKGDSNTALIPAYLSIQNPIRFIDNSDWSAKIRMARQRGHDGIVYLNRYEGDGVLRSVGDGLGRLSDAEFLAQFPSAQDSWIAFNPEQIKSATGNAGTFDPANPDIRYSQAQFAGRDLPAETRTQKARRVAQDYFLRTKIVQDFVIGQGGTVGEAQDVYRAEERSYGRVQAQLEDFAKRWVQPMLEKAAKAGVEMDELALYAYAKHAPERNAYIDTINPAMNGAGSGMSDADAAKIVADVQASGKAQAFEDLRQDLLAITETTRQVLLQDGLITQDEYDAWTNAYQDYVPLRGLENVDDEGRPKPGVGRGVNIRGKESVAALGRRSRAGDVIENIVRDYERAVIRGERNNVAKTFLDLVTTNPDPDLWEVNAQKTNRTLSKATGLVQMSTSTDSGEDTVGVKVGGQQVYIKVKDPLLLRAMRQAAKDETGEFQSMLAKSLGVYNNWLRNTLTRYNPVFGAVNAVRDLQAGAVATLDKLGAQGLKLYSKHYRAALAASVRNEFDALGKTGSMFGDPVMDKWFDEYRRAGGTTAGWFLRDVEDIHTDIRQMMVAAGSAPRNTGERITGSVAWQAGKSLLKYVELFGSASENAGRVAAYRAAREMGRSPAEAASIAKNLTTNFNRKGEWGTALSSAYLFFNAAVQGTARVLEALKNRRVQALMGGVSAMAATLAVMGAEMGGDDDDGQAYWDKIPDYEKERNLIIMLPPGIQHDGVEKVGEMGRYIKVPMPYGFNVFAVLGYTMADAGRYAVDPMRGKSPAKLAINLVSAVAGSYNPMGGAFDVTDPVAVGMAVAPTIVDAGIQLGAGVNSFGTPVGPKGSPFDTRPDSERFTVSQGGGASQRLARWMNENTGGNRARSGAIDVMPGTIDNVVSMAGGGTGKFLFDVFVNMPTKLSNDESVFRYRDLPFLRNFAGQVDENVDRGLFYERMDEVLKEARAAKNEMKMGIAVKYDPRSRAMQSIGKMADDYSGLMTDLRKEDLAIVNDPSLTAEERKSQRKDVERRRNEFVREFNRAFLETERDLARGSFDKE